MRLTAYKIELWQAAMIAGLAIIATLFAVHWHRNTEATKDMLESSGLGLEDLVQRLRSELEKMEEHRIANATPALFRLKDFDLELSFVVKANEKQTGKIEFKIVTAEMERELGNENTHKITLHMQMVEPNSIHLGPPKQRLSSTGAIQLPVLKLGRQ